MFSSGAFTGELISGFIYLTACAVQIVTSLLTLRRVQGVKTWIPQSCEPVTILIPFAGSDENADRTLASYFSLSYPQVHLIFCGASDDEPATALVRKLIVDTPNVQADLLIGRSSVSANPKLDNLEKAWKSVKSNWIIIADANIIIPTDYIESLLGAAETDHIAGLISAVPLGSEPKSFWAWVECAFLNTYQARFLLTADAFGRGFAHGKTMGFRRELLDCAGGPASLASDVAEDSAATKIVRKAGLRVRLMSRPVHQPLGNRTFRDVWARQMRWAQLRSRSYPWIFASEALSSYLVPVLAAVSFASVTGFPWSAAAVSLAIAVSVDLMLARAAAWPFSWNYIGACLCRELMIWVIWPTAWFTRRYSWRGNIIDLDGRIARKI
ncbi:MAG: glycosyltransferase [Proteobacteria bacterium]|nr:glycosyltransferase [Pseudomonadota bacterium]